MSVNGTFDKDRATALSKSVDDLLKVGSDQVVLEFSGEDKNACINTINKNSGANTISMVTYDEALFEGFDIEDTKFGVYELGEYNSLCRIFATGYDFNFDGKVATVVNESQQFDYHAADVEIIPKGPTTFNADKVTWFAEFTWDNDEYKTFNRAASTLKCKHIVFSGNKGEKTLNVKVAEYGVRSTSFNVDVDLVDPVEDDFEVVVKREYFLPIVNGSCGSYKIQIGDRVLYFNGKTDYYTSKTYLVAEDKTSLR